MPTAARRAHSTRRVPAPTSDSRQRLLESALVVFAERGFDGATTRNIAAHAGANLGLVQYHFGGKEQLWRAAVDHGFEALWSALAAAAPSAQPADQLADTIRAAVRFAAAHPALVRLMNDEGKRDGRRLRWIVDRHGRRLYELTTTMLAQARDRGVLVDVAPLHLYYTFIGAAGMIFSQAAECRRLTGTDPTASSAIIDAHAEVLVRLFLGA